MANTTVLNLVKPLGTDHALVSDINANSDKIDAEAGKVRANFSAEYSASSAYAVGAFCTHDGNVYQCNTAIGSGGEAWTAGHWTQISVGDAITANNQAIATLDYQIVTSGDFDNLTGNNVATVWYRGENLSNFTHAPSDVSSNAWPFALEAIKVGAGYVRQILHIYAVYANLKTQVRTFIRQQTYRNGAIEWGAWEEYALESDIAKCASSMYSKYSDSSGSITVEIPASNLYLMVIGQFSSTYGALYVLSCSASTLFANPIKSDSHFTVTTSGRNVSVTSSLNYWDCRIIKIGSA